MRALLSLLALSGLGCSSRHYEPPLTDRGVRVLPEAGGGSTDAAGIGDADTYSGNRGTVTGTIAFSPPPLFPGFPQENFIESPAIVHFPYQGFDYKGDYDPVAKKFSLDKIPVGSSFVMVEDKDGQNGIFNTLMHATADNGLKWTLPAIRRDELLDIYAKAGVTLDESKAQVIMTLYTSPLQGNVPMAGASVSLQAQMDTVLYDQPGGGFSQGGETGPLGMAILVNMDAGAYPGKKYAFTFTWEGKTNSKLAFYATNGAVARIPIQDDGTRN